MKTHLLNNTPYWQECEGQALLYSTDRVDILERAVCKTHQITRAHTFFWPGNSISMHLSYR